MEQGSSTVTRKSFWCGTCPGHVPQPFTGLCRSVTPGTFPPTSQTKCNQCTISPEVTSLLS